MKRPFSLTAAGVTDRGMQREANEDSWGGPPPNLPPEVIAAKGLLYIVADGVGGHRGGEIASRLAVQVTQQVYYADPNPDIQTSLRAAIQEANRQIYHQGISNPAEYGMSTTITAAVVRGNQLMVANVGDSRAYLIKDGEAYQITVDHSWVAERTAAGLLTPQEAANHPQRNIITRSLGGALEVQVDVFGPYPLAQGDQVLLCTDGLSDIVTPQEMAYVVAQSRNPHAAANRLVNLANERGAPDNVTAVVISTRRPMPAVRGPVALAGILGTVILLGVMAVMRQKLAPPLWQPTQTVTPTPTLSPTTTPSPTPLPTPQLIGPGNGETFYLGKEVTLAWTWPLTLEVDQRFVVVVSGTQMLTETVGPGKEMAYRFRPREEGEYRWTVWVEREVDGEWKEVARAGEWHTFKVQKPPPTLTPTPTFTPTPTPTATPPPPPPPPTLPPR